MKENYDKRKVSYKSKSKTIHSKKSFKQRFQDFAFTEEFQKELQENEEKQKASNSNTSQKIKNNSKKSSRFIKSIFFIFKSIILICIIAIAVFFIPYLSIAFNSYVNGFDTARIDIETVPHIYDKDGNLISVMYGYYDTGSENFIPTYSSIYTDISSLPNYVGDAFTAIEDETFYDNSGISINRLAYATFNYIVKGDSSFGGSTITQQLVKVATGDNSHSPSRKAREIGSALYLTDNWSKAKILASYMNLVYYR